MGCDRFHWSVFRITLAISGANHYPTFRTYAGNVAGEVVFAYASGQAVVSSRIYAPLAPPPTLPHRDHGIGCTEQYRESRKQLGIKGGNGPTIPHHVKQDEKHREQDNKVDAPHAQSLDRAISASRVACPRPWPGRRPTVRGSRVISAPHTRNIGAR